MPMDLADVPTVTVPPTAIAEGTIGLPARVVMSSGRSFVGRFLATGITGHEEAVTLLGHVLSADYLCLVGTDGAERWLNTVQIAAVTFLALDAYNAIAGEQGAF